MTEPVLIAVVEHLRSRHGPLIFRQLGGCCDGSSPNVLPTNWQHTQLIIDVVTGRGSGFSLEAPEGVRFLTRSRACSPMRRAARSIMTDCRSPCPRSTAFVA
jgi:uncharacterized protein (DUF779 family)